MLTNTRILFLTLTMMLSGQGSLAFSPALGSPRAMTALSVGYVPDGLTAQQYKQIQQQDEQKKGKNLGQLGPRGFKSRSMQAWQEAYERGETGHSFAPWDYQNKLKQGRIRKEDIPYMVRGGSWDNSDLFGVRRLRWGNADREYARGGYKKEQSVSILGSGPGLNWTGEKRDPGNKRSFPGFS